jgi:hypothetical protein
MPGLGRSQSGEQGQNECQFLHAPIFSEGMLGFKGGAAGGRNPAITRVRPGIGGAVLLACEASLLATLFAAVAVGASWANVARRVAAFLAQLRRRQFRDDGKLGDGGAVNARD